MSKHRGAQPANINAIKHGFYSTRNIGPLGTTRVQLARIRSDLDAHLASNPHPKDPSVPTLDALAADLDEVRHRLVTHLLDPDTPLDTSHRLLSALNGSTRTLARIVEARATKDVGDFLDTLDVALDDLSEQLAAEL